MGEESATYRASDRFIVQLWRRTEGKAWEPPDMRHPIIADLIERGFIRRCTMRCGFEAFNTGVTWTDAGRTAVSALLTNGADRPHGTEEHT